MKKLIFLFGIILISSIVIGQTTAIWDSIRVPNNIDTIVTIRTNEQNFSVTFEFDDFDDVDATIDIGQVPPGKTFALRNTADTNFYQTLDDDRLPFTLSDTASSVQGFEKSQSNFKFLAFKLTKGSVTAGLYLRYYLTIW